MWTIVADLRSAEATEAGLPELDPTEAIEALSSMETALLAYLGSETVRGSMSLDGEDVLRARALEDALEESRTGRIEATALASLAEATLDATIRRLRTGCSARFARRSPSSDRDES